MTTIDRQSDRAVLAATPKAAAPEFSVRDAREIVKDLFEPSPLIYWTDMIVSLVIGTLGLRMLRLEPAFSPLQIAGYLITVLAFYRVGSFTHELVHLRTGTFHAFRVVWNAAVGIPFLMPSFMYYTHIAHHARNHYGTDEDGEYLSLAAGPRSNILRYMSMPLWIPLVAILRFLVLAPLGWINPRIRRWLHQRASSLVMDPSYVRPIPSDKDLRVWRLQEFACFLVTVAGVAVFASGYREMSLLLKIYLVGVGVVGLNQIRTLGAHRFRHNGEQVTFLQQLLDSVNYPNRPWLTELWAPVGLRYHALHHLFPSMPYHKLDEAHHRLMARLPSDSPYRQTVSRGLWSSIGQLWRSAGTGRAG